MKIKNIAIFILLMAVTFVNAQNVYLSKVEKTKDNNDKYFYQIDPKNSAAEYLGEIDVQGFSNDDASVFAAIYKKAKEIGANAFSYKPFESVDEKTQPFNPANYRLELYYSTKEELLKPSDSIYFFSSSSKPQTISVNRKDYTLPPRSFTTIQGIPGEIYTVSTKKFLGSNIKISVNANAPAQYFQISAAKIKSNTFGEPGINLKSGDILGLDKSFGDFLRMIYTENK
ncbi:hypothetical protein [Chryseobacterium indoltheticum]|uniref:Molecular chaperone GroES n=1 Tax=Chryseobacterium indoltheticum TaxID=254 RepID=A0A381F591_9FLAO|nr:hypothetical protein [Chryseobacterium indoltheticum]AZA75796.1 hypothetical protein EG358_19575 [Chryseobacterium indoltheticum]SIR07364.1 hypothetical protein SAMN05421682_1121 [Chryseobacterium indoltheticum]SUX41769.1 Uncharacterised protein [Chryseobacterium indoltheticum]